MQASPFQSVRREATSHLVLHSDTDTPPARASEGGRAIPMWGAKNNFRLFHFQVTESQNLNNAFDCAHDYHFDSSHVPQNAIIHARCSMPRDAIHFKESSQKFSFVIVSGK